MILNYYLLIFFKSLYLDSIAQIYLYILYHIIWKILNIFSWMQICRH